MRDVLTITDLDGVPHRVTRAGTVYAYGDALSCAAPLTLLSDAAKVADWSGGRSQRRKRIDDLLARFGRLELTTELRFDAPHGGRYVLAAYGGAPFTAERQRQRRVVLAAIDHIHDLRQHWIDAGSTEAELDWLMQRPDPFNPEAATLRRLREENLA